MTVTVAGLIIYCTTTDCCNSCLCYYGNRTSVSTWTMTPMHESSYLLLLDLVGYYWTQFVDSKKTCIADSI